MEPTPPGAGGLLDLEPAPGEEGRVVEPGHCFEWAWLFETLARWDFPQATAISDGMTRFARRWGLDHVRGVAAARLWP